MSKLLIKFPTRGRPNKFLQRMKEYTELLSGKHHVRFVISIDDDDETMTNPEIIQKIDEFKSENVEVDSYIGFSKTKIEAVNADLDDYDDDAADILLVASDDMIPEAQGYDDIIFRDMAQAYPDYNGAIKYSDGLRQDSLMTLCVMGWKLYKEFGYIYHPDYESVYADNEQTIVLSSAGKLAISPLCIVKHAWKHELDDLHARNERPEVYQRDGEIFKKRMNLGFPKEQLEATTY